MILKCKTIINYSYNQTESNIQQATKNMYKDLLFKMSYQSFGMKYVNE